MMAPVTVIVAYDTSEASPQTDKHVRYGSKELWL